MSSLLLFLAALSLTAFSSGTETAFSTASRIRAYSRLREGKRWAGLTLEFLEHPSRFLTTTLIGTNVGMVLSSALTESFAHRVLVPWLAPVLVAALALFILVFTEMLPKHLLLLSRERVVSTLALPLMILRVLFLPVIVVTESICFLIVGRKRSPGLFESKAEILALLSGSSVEAGRLAERALKLDSESAGDAMRSLEGFPSTRAGATRRSILSRSIESEFPFLLVRDKDGKTVRGFVDTSTAAGSAEVLEDASIKGFPYFDESADLMSVISGLSRTGAPAGMVIGSDGQPAGMVILDDIVDLLLGDPGGEASFSREPEHFLAWPDGRATVV
jgi:CBS domain containing-hemolysin-like protein